VVPEVLRKYIPGAPETLPYTKDLPKDTTSQKVKAKQGGGGVGKEQGQDINVAAAKMQDLKV